MVSCASTQNEIYGYKLEMSYCNQSALLISTGCDAMVSLMEECILCLSRCTCGFSYSPFYLFVSMSDSCTFYPHSRCCRKKLLLMNHSFNSFKELVEVLKEWGSCGNQLRLPSPPLPSSRCQYRKHTVSTNVISAIQLPHFRLYTTKVTSA